MNPLELYNKEYKKKLNNNCNCDIFNIDYDDHDINDIKIYEYYIDLIDLLDKKILSLYTKRIPKISKKYKIIYKETEIILGYIAKLYKFLKKKGFTKKYGMEFIYIIFYCNIDNKWSWKL